MVLGVASASAIVAKLAETEPVLAMVIVQRTTAPGMFFGLVVLLNGSHNVATDLATDRVAVWIT